MPVTIFVVYGAVGDRVSESIVGVALFTVTTYCPDAFSLVAVLVGMLHVTIGYFRACDRSSANVGVAPLAVVVG